MNYLLLNQETERLAFRALTKKDFGTWLPFFEDKQILTYFGIDPNLPHQELCENWFTKVFHRYENNLGGMNAIILKETGELIGQCGLLIQTVQGKKRLEVGYSLLQKFRGFGYGSEAAIKCKEFAFDNSLAGQLISMIHIDNLASEKVALKNGMSLESIIDYEGMVAKIYTIEKG
jgi:ribosomal-protein-alanine N-acetyltransferase